MNNNKKTILCVGLVATIILSFSGMLMADAATDEKTSDKTNNKAKKIDKGFEPPLYTPEEAFANHRYHQEAAARGEKTVGLNNQMDTDKTPHPVRGTGPGCTKP